MYTVSGWQASVACKPSELLFPCGQLIRSHTVVMFRCNKAVLVVQVFHIHPVDAHPIPEQQIATQLLGGVPRIPVAQPQIETSPQLPTVLQRRSRSSESFVCPLPEPMSPSVPRCVIFGLPTITPNTNLE
ncbi:hypothetical protein FHS14_006263 [Paenibacillus baekrokdamisoli]|nr:hypothetical protein [Paenibacillus baekrokdamisoli]